MSGGAGTPDFFYREAQRLGYVARSAFKLLQMQKQYKLISAGSSVLDLGCAPGAWLQVACQNLGPLINGGAVVGIDIKKVKVPSLYCDSRVKTVCADVMSLPREQVKALSPQIVTSKYSPNSTTKMLTYVYQLANQVLQAKVLSGLGVFHVVALDGSALVYDAELGMQAINLAVGTAALARTEAQSDGSGVLQPEGHLVVKLLESEDVKELSQICKPLFRKASWLRPRATRSSSREIYLICQGFKQL